MKIKTLLSLFLFFLFSVATSWAEDSYPEYITDIKLIGGTQDKVDNLLPEYKKLGWTIIDVNLNEGVKGSDFVFLIYKKGSRASTDGGYVTDLYLNAQPEHSDYPDGSQTETITYDGRTYYRAPYDGNSDFYMYCGHLNAKAGGMNIHLYYTKANFSDKRALTSITSNDKSYNDGNDKVLYWWNNLKDHPANVNIGNNGSAIYIHVTTATKKNRPSSDPVMATGLVYNGQPQKLIKTAATISSGTMYYKVGSEEYTSTASEVMATEAGDHTVSYYAGANDYSDASDVLSQTVTIAKSPNSSASISITSSLYWDETLPPPVINNLSTGTITYKYSTSQNGTYSTTKPVSSGTYWVKAEIAGDDNCDPYTTAATSFRFVGWTGSGTSAKPYIISSTEELDFLASRVNNGNTYNGAYFELGANITYVPVDSDKDGEYESNFTPIGKNEVMFRGSFNGKGHTVSGIVVKNGGYYTGFFGHAGGSASIKNLTIANSLIEGSDYVGGVVGYTDNSNVVIENCHVSQNSVKGSYYVGGIVGYNYGNIRGSSSDATVSGSSDVGGIVGKNNGSVENSLYFGTSVTARQKYFVGAISGELKSSGSFKNNYHTLSGMGGVGNSESATGEDADGARKAVALSAVDGVTLTLAGNPVNYDVSGITAYEKDGKFSSGILYDGKLYAGATEKVVLNLGYTVSDYEVLTGYTDGNGNALAANDDGSYTLTMKSAAATVTPAIKYLWGEGTKGTAENPYIISSTEGLDLLAQKVNGGNNYDGKYFELGADITYDPIDSNNDGELETNFTPIGFEDLFYGKFDGKGHTVSGIVVNADKMGVGLFGHVAGSASIKNLTLANSSFVSNQNNMGGIVGAVWGADVVIENCHVSSDVSVKGNYALGGIVGYNIGAISGSTSEAQVSGVQSVGGIVGNNLGVIENNLYLGTSVSATDKNKVGAIAGYVDRGHPDCKASFTNNYHTLDGMGGVGNTESATGEDTDDAMLAKVVTEKPTDIGKAGTPYGTDDYVGITPYTRGLEYKDNFYYKPLWNGNGTEADPYIITSTEGLDKLASDVNSGNHYKNTYFELGADITYEPKNLTVDLDNNSKNESNFTPIGYNNHYFYGSFDGKGHTVSGIVVESNSDYVGLFGYVGSSVSIKNLTLANSSIKGNNNVGGIVGYVAYSSDTDPFVENCHVSANVLVKGGQYVGGIAGYNSEKIIGCTSDANVSGNGYVGGIVGENGGLVKNSLYLGKSVTATGNSRVGAIAGYVSYGGSFTNNYHTLEGKGGEGNYANTGSDTEGAEFAAPFSVEPAGIGTVETSYGTGDYVGITPYTNGLAYKGRYYYAGTLVEGYAAVQIFKDAEDKKHAIIDGEYDGPDAVNIEENIDVTSVTFNREFTPNSGYATIMFPFNVNASSLTGVRSIIEFDGISKIDGKNAVGMTYVWCDATLGEQEHEKGHTNCNGLQGELKAYTPYMVDMKSATLGIDGEITLKPNSGKTVGDASKDNWVFRGTLQKKEWPKGTGIINEGRLWAFAAAERSGAKIGEFVQFGGNNWANPFRAYLVECKKTDNGLDCSDEDSETQPSLVSKYRFADALAPTNSAEKSAGAAATDQSLVMRGVAASETASLNSMDIVIVYGDKESDGDKERPTVIGRMNPATGEIRMLPRTKQTYDLKGRKVGNGKKAKGAYYRK